MMQLGFHISKNFEVFEIPDNGIACWGYQLQPNWIRLPPSFLIRMMWYFISTHLIHFSTNRIETNVIVMFIWCREEGVLIYLIWYELFSKQFPFEWIRNRYVQVCYINRNWILIFSFISLSSIHLEHILRNNYILIELN